MAPRQQADQHAVHDVLLADDDLSDFLAHLLEVAGCKLESGVRTHVFILAVAGSGRSIILAAAGGAAAHWSYYITRVMPFTNSPGDNGVQQRLTDLRNGLLGLHKTLLDSERAVYERDIARISSTGELLKLVLYDPWFAWLHELSEFVVLIDEILDAEEPPTSLDAERLIAQAGDLLAPRESGIGFAKRYFEALQRDPDVVLAHGRMRKLMATLSG